MDANDTKLRSLKACTVCASAKVRCDMVLGQKRCTRCERLNKECISQPRGSHSRRSHSKGGTYARDDLLRLESKFDSVANLLSSSSTTTLPSITIATHPRKASSATSSSSQTPPETQSPIHALFSYPLSSTSHRLAYKMLETYRQEMMPLFPFVWIGLDEIPEKLFQDRPMLYMAIMVVTCQENIEIQQELAQKYREEIGRRIWTLAEKNLQLLQGIMVFLAWYQTHWVLGHQLSNLMYMAMSLVTELGLDKEPSSGTRTAPGVLTEITKKQEPQPVRTSDERRCHLGVFWLNSLLRICVKDFVPMPSRPSINNSCSVLEAGLESPWDTYLTQLVRIQLVASSISATLYQDLERNEAQISHTLFMATSHVERQVQDLGATLHQGSRLQVAPLTMSFHMLQVYLYKIGIDERLHEPTNPNLLPAADPSPHALRCSYLLVSCLNAVKAVIENFLLLTSPTILSMPYTYWIQMGHCINMFSRLLVTHSTLWDPNLVTGIHDFTSTLERLAVKIEGAMSEGAGLYGSFLAHAYPVEHSAKFSRLVVFGDSFSDNGNGSWVVSNGTWPVDPAYYHHSFSNGPKWNDVVAKQLGLELINLATGGATTNNDFVAGGTGAESTIPVPSAADQVLSFLSWDKPQAGDIFVHWIGANDILFNTSITGGQVTSLINENVNRLFQAGAKTIILANYLNATTFPATYNSSAYNVPSVQDYVPALTKGLEQVAAGYSAYAKTAVIDVQELFNDMFSDPEAYGFDEDYVNPPTACLTGVYTSEGVPRHLCSDPEKHIFFDSYHPVKEVHALVAKLFVESIEGFSA
ncbi:hypothetical protein LB506_006265 [Fusarium annulatum]|nr:hypothetical protein LB506_006265 [Fusarium annulatum]